MNACVCFMICVFLSRSNTNLGDNDCEIRVVRGIQYNPPSGINEVLIMLFLVVLTGIL